MRYILDVINIQYYNNISTSRTIKVVKRWLSKDFDKKMHWPFQGERTNLYLQNFCVIYANFFFKRLGRCK